MFDFYPYVEQMIQLNGLTNVFQVESTRIFFLETPHVSLKASAKNKFRAVHVVHGQQPD